MIRLPYQPYANRIFLNLWESGKNPNASSISKYIKKHYRGVVVSGLVSLRDDLKSSTRYEKSIKFMNDEDATMFLLRWA